MSSAATLADPPTPAPPAAPGTNGSVPTNYYPAEVQHIQPRATAVRVDAAEGSITLDLEDGRTLIVPVTWSGRLPYAKGYELRNVEIIGGGTTLAWPDLDEQLDVAALLAGRRSVEGGRSLQAWIDARESEANAAE